MALRTTLLMNSLGRPAIPLIANYSLVCGARAKVRLRLTAPDPCLGGAVDGGDIEMCSQQQDGGGAPTSSTANTGAK